MVAYSVFDKLVGRLSSSERRDMLRRIASSVPVAALENGPAEDAIIDLDEAYRTMGLLRRFLILLLTFFSGRDRHSFVEGYLLRDLMTKVVSTIPCGFDTVQHQFRPDSSADFRMLAERARRFSGVLARVMGRERRSFIAFLVGLHAPEVQERLVSDADPFQISASAPDLKDTDVKRHAHHEIEQITGTLSPEVRRKIYTDVRALHQLMALSSFPFDRVVGGFFPVPGGDPMPLSVRRVADELSRLATIYDGLRHDPSGVLFEALGLYQDQDRLDEDDAAVEALVQRNVDALAAAYSDIRGFGRRYPLADLVRIANENIHSRPAEAGGGEDWFAQWKGFWRDRLEETHRRYSYQRRIEAAIGQARSALELRTADSFPGYPPSGLDQPARHGLSAGILRVVMEGVFEHEVADPLGVLYREGEFYNGDNRRDLERMWHAIERLRTDLASFEVRLQPTGDLGTSWRQASDDSRSGDVALERQSTLAASIDREASSMVRRAIEAFHLLAEILQGVLYGTVGGRYDTISNLDELAGERSAAAYRKSLELAHSRCKAAVGVLSDILDVETSIEAA